MIYQMQKEVKWTPKYDLAKLIIDEYDYSEWYKYKSNYSTIKGEKNN